MKTMGISIREIPNYELDAQEIYSVTVGGEKIKTVVTKNAATVDHWIGKIYSDHKGSLDHLTAGLDVDWKPAVGVYDNHVAILTLCVGRRCLIFQILHADKIPKSLHGFLQNENLRFAGVGIESATDKLGRCYDLWVHSFVDPGDLAAEKYCWKEFKNTGLMGLATRFLRIVEIEKPGNVTVSNWSQKHLTGEQIHCACVDAYVSSKIARLFNIHVYFPSSM